MKKKKNRLVITTVVKFFFYTPYMRLNDLNDRSTNKIGGNIIEKYFTYGQKKRYNIKCTQ